MCYNVVTATKTQLKYAQHRGESTEQIAELEEELRKLERIFRDPKYYADGFGHPNLLVFTNERPYAPGAFRWGLMPSWAKDRDQANKSARSTLNARVETIFEKPSFRNSAEKKRCLVYLDGFYEYHHFQKVKYPFHVSLRDESPMIAAGLWNDWVDTETGEIINTVSIVTTEANELMRRIHNNPDAEGPRMPLLLTKEMQNEWLKPYNGDETKELIKELAQPFNTFLMQAYPVPQLKGKAAIGNVPAATMPYKYDALLLDQDVNDLLNL